MKKQLLTISAAVLMSTAIFANGTDDPKKTSESASGAAVIRNGDNTFRVIYKAEKENDVKVSILNDKNELVFSEKVNNTDGFTRPYNFGSLKEGDYTIAIEDQSKKQLEKVSYRSERATKTLNVLKLSKDGKYLITAAGSGSETITIDIYDGAHNLLHKSIQDTKGNYAQLFNLKDVKGHLTFEISNENGETKSVSY